MALYDKKKYEVDSNMPESFAQVIPGIGIQHFSKKNLTNNDCKALISAGSKYVKDKAVDYKEDEPK